MTKGIQISRTEYVTPKTEQNLTRIDATENSCATTLQPESIVVQPTAVTIQQIEPRYKSGRIGQHTRKVKDKTYTNPRLFLSSRLNEHIGRRCRIFKAKGTMYVGWDHREDQHVYKPNLDILIVVLLPS
jgi:hypothetical protein